MSGFDVESRGLWFCSSEGFKLQATMPAGAFYGQEATMPAGAFYGQEPNAVYGSKAVGEPPLMLGISVREALKDAISSFGGTEVMLAVPSTPEAILNAVERVKEAREEVVSS